MLNISCTQLGEPGTEEGALLNLFYDARLYSAGIISTIRAIEAGIQSAYAEETANSEAIYDGIINAPS